jgi:outer membrane protein assembly factor BamA
MKSKTHLLLQYTTAGLLSWIISSSATAAPLVSIGDNTDIFFNGSSSLRWSSNIFSDAGNEESDVSWTVSPGFEINVGRGVSNADLTVITRYDVVKYQDNDQLDTELFHLEALGSYETGRLELSSSFSFGEYKLNSGDRNVVADLVEFDDTKGDLEAEYQFSQKFSFSAGLVYTDREFQTYQDIFSNRETTRFPLNVYYELTPKLDLSLGYDYSKTDIEGGNSFGGLYDPIAGYEQDSDFFNIGLRGNIGTKLTGFFKIGYRDVNADNTNLTTNGGVFDSSIERSDRNMLGLDASLTWMASNKLSYQLALSRDYDTGALGQSREVSSAKLTGNYTIDSQWTAMANLGYSDRDSTYIGRQEEQLSGGLRFMYSLNEYWRFSAGYSYYENDSNQASRSYENEILDLTAILRY